MMLMLGLVLLLVATSNVATESADVIRGNRAAKVIPDQNRTLRAFATIEAPYITLKSDWEELGRVGNDKYEGYIVDLMDLIRLETGLHYEIEHQNMSHGYKNSTTGKWAGLIAELIEERADLVVGGLTITAEREKVVDFTAPFMNIGIGILLRKPDRRSSTAWKLVLLPFSAEVWLYTAAAFLATAVTIALLTRITSRTQDKLDRQTRTPRSVRLAKGLLCFFSLVVVIFYTASLGSFLSADQTDGFVLPIDSAEDLSKQTQIKYGCYQGGATYSFFKNSVIPIYKQMWHAMNQDSTNFVVRGQHGVERVLEGQYAYLMESPSLEYAVNRDCRLMQVGGLLDAKNFGIATQQGDDLRDRISIAILKLLEIGELHMLKDKWWKKKDGVNCLHNLTPAPRIIPDGVHIANFVLVLSFLLVGLVFSCVVGAVEVCRDREKQVQDSRRLRQSNSIEL